MKHGDRVMIKGSCKTAKIIEVSKYTGKVKIKIDACGAVDYIKKENLTSLGDDK